MKGISSTCAPSLLSSPESEPAWWRARPTSTRIPVRDRFLVNFAFALMIRARLLRLLLQTESMFAHQARSAGHCRVGCDTERIDDLLLLFSGAVLAQLELCVKLGHSYFESHNMIEQSLTIGFTQAGPLLLVTCFECRDQVVQYVEQVLWFGECLRGAVGVNRTVVPRGNSFLCIVIRGRDVGVRTVEDHQAGRFVLQISPVRVGLGDVTADGEMITGFTDYHRNMRGEGAIVCRGDQNGEWVGPHEGQSCGTIFDAEMFGDVHSRFLFKVLTHHREHRISFSVLFCVPAAKYFAVILAIAHGCGGTVSPRPYTASRIASPPRFSSDAPASLPSFSGSEPSRESRNNLVPSGFATIDSRSSLPSRTSAKAPMGTWQPPPRLLSRARSHVVAARASGSLRNASSSRVFTSPSQISMPSAPCPAAGHITSAGMISLINSVFPRRFRPAEARIMASYSPCSSLRRRVSTLPRNG